MARGERRTSLLKDKARSLISSSGKIDYIEIVDQESLEPLSELDRPGLCALAVYFGKTRLIDNRRV